MFDGKKYKNFARIQLKGRLRPVVAVAAFQMAIFIILQLRAIFCAIKGIPYNTESKVIFLNHTLNFVVLVISAILTMAYRSLLIKMSKSPDPVTFRDFIDELALWPRAVFCALWNTLWVFLWSLLFVIPGIVKSYSYYFMFHIMAEFPKVSAVRAMQISKLITDGHKADILVMQLSFLPWVVLTFLTAGVGAIFLTPYYELSFVNAFHALVLEALNKGVLIQEDLI